MRKSGGEPMSCGYSPTPPAACAWSAHSPSKPTKTGSKPTATSIWTNCASRRKPNYAKPHDQHHDRQFAELDAHNRVVPEPYRLGWRFIMRTAGEGSAKSRQLGPGARGAGGAGALPCRHTPGVVNPKAKTSPRCAAARLQGGRRPLRAGDMRAMAFRSCRTHLASVRTDGWSV